MFNRIDGFALQDISNHLNRIAECLEYYVEKSKKEVEEAVREKERTQELVATLKDLGLFPED